MGPKAKTAVRAFLLTLLLSLLGLVAAVAAGEAYCRLSHRCVIERRYSYGGGACRTKHARFPAPGYLSDFPVCCRLVRRDFFAGKQLFQSEMLLESQQHHQRFVPFGRGDDEKEGALFFGCSFMFGNGVNDEESLPSVFARELDGVEVRNFAESGTGPASMLKALREGTPRLDAFPKRGPNNYAFYGLLGSHVLRTQGAHGAGCTWVGSLPRFKYDAQGKLRQEGVLFDDCPLPRAPLEWLVGISQLAQYFSIYWFNPPGEADLRFTADVILSARDAFRERFGSENFIVVVFPSPDLPAWKDSIVKHLRAGGVTVLDYYGLVDFQRPEYHLPYDNHPTALTQRLVAEALVRDFKAYRARHR